MHAILTEVPLCNSKVILTEHHEKNTNETKLHYWSKHKKIVGRSNQYISYYSILRKIVKWNRKSWLIISTVHCWTLLHYMPFLKQQQKVIQAVSGWICKTGCQKAAPVLRTVLKLSVTLGPLTRSSKGHKTGILHRICLEKGKSISRSDFSLKKLKAQF